MNVKNYSTDGPLTWQQPEHQSESEDQQKCSGYDEKPVRSVEQHEAQAAPAIMKRPEMRCPSPLVRPECDGDLGELRAHLGSFDDQLQGELHSRSAWIDGLVNAFGEPSHAAIGVANACAEEVVQNGGERGISDELMRLRHGTRFDAAGKTVSHDKFRPGPPPLDELGNLTEIVAVIGITHDDELPPGFLNALAQCVAVSLESGMRDPRAPSFGDLD